MTFPIDIQIGLLYIPSHFLFEVLAFGVGYRLYLSLKERRGDALSDVRRWYVVVAAAFGALVGAYLLAALERPEQFLDPPHVLFHLQQKTILGALAGGILAVESTKLIAGVRRTTGDLFVYPLILGIMIGRVGCFLTGVKDATVGIVSDVPWAFPQGDGLPRHPTALYEILFLGVLFLALRVAEKRGVFAAGGLFRGFIIGYFIFRLFVEFIKPVEPIVLNLSAIQWVSLVFLLYYLATLPRYISVSPLARKLTPATPEG